MSECTAVVECRRCGARIVIARHVDRDWRPDGPVSAHCRVCGCQDVYEKVLLVPA